MNKMFLSLLLFVMLGINSAVAGCIAGQALTNALQNTKSINANNFIDAYQNNPLPENECLLLGGLDAYCEIATEDMAPSDAHNACESFKQEVIQEHNQYVHNNATKVTQAYVGCNDATGISRTVSGCSAQYSNNATELNRCKNCVNVAGTYENGRCFIEIVAWNCTGKGWVKTTNNPLKCAEANKYHDCRMIHKYVDAERAFTCDAASILGTKSALLSGCAQHGCSSGAKHPPFHITGDKVQDCKLPLANNTAWRVPYRTGAAVGVVRNGANVMTTDWCMPAKDSNPWNSSNDNGRFKHLCAPTLVDGQSISRWHSID